MTVTSQYFLTLCFIFLNTSIIGDEPTFIIKFTSNKCLYVNNDIVANMTCNLKPIRGGMGVLTFKATLIKPFVDIWLDCTIFYKFGTAYRSWLFHCDVDLCAIMNDKPNNVYEQLVASIYKYQKYHKSETEHPMCPLENEINTIINMENASVNAFPTQIDRLPSGDYKVMIRAHSKINRTFFIVEVKFQVKSKRGKMTTMLEMG